MNTNIPVFSSGSISTGEQKRMDSRDLFFFEHELTHYDPREFPNLKKNLTAFDVFHILQVDPAMITYNYSMTEATGEAIYASTQEGENDNHPYVGVEGHLFSTTMFDIISALKFSHADLLASQATRRDKVSSLRNQAMRVNLERMNKTCFIGNQNPSVSGLLNNPHIEQKGVKSGNGEWSGKKAEALLEDLNEAYDAILKATSNLIRPDTMLISTAAHNDIDSRIFNTFNGTTVLKQFSNRTGIKVISTPELNGAFKGKDGFVMFENNPAHIQHLVAELFRTTPVQPKKNSYEVFCESRHGGLIVRQPKSIVIRHGI